MMPAVTPPPLPAPIEPPHNPVPHRFIRGTRALAVGALLALILLGLTWELWLAPTGSRWLAFKVVPLVFPLAGLLKHRLYTYRWVSLLVWLYFTEGIVRATGLPTGAAAGLNEALAWAQVALCVLLFAACAAHVRWRLKHPSATPDTLLAVGVKTPPGATTRQT